MASFTLCNHQSGPSSSLALYLSLRFDQGFDNLSSYSQLWVETVVIIEEGELGRMAKVLMEEEGEDSVVGIIPVASVSLHVLFIMNNF